MCLHLLETPTLASFERSSCQRPTSTPRHATPALAACRTPSVRRWRCRRGVSSTFFVNNNGDDARVGISAVTRYADGRRAQARARRRRAPAPSCCCVWRWRPEISSAPSWTFAAPDYSTPRCITPRSLP
ncbi:unnamed protein product [Chrysodeixis includens]|uniref:Uncharacterized protein n=1 Tax=Chrysodeixis includens TaxID=689277 RepID=A0A9N8KYD7_CHRIL|nr:unnamed protein product [Chrysodeixis includens]